MRWDPFDREDVVVPLGEVPRVGHHLPHSLRGGVDLDRGLHHAHGGAPFITPPSRWSIPATIRPGTDAAESTRRHQRHLLPCRPGGCGLAARRRLDAAPPARTPPPPPEQPCRPRPTLATPPPGPRCARR